MRIAVDANIILSGLFFKGNERQLILESLKGRVVLVFPEDIVEEVYQVIAETFGGRTDLPRALELLEAVFSEGELVRRVAYAAAVRGWASKLRDPTDAPLLACAMIARVDAVVTGDKDILEQVDAAGIDILRTKEVLDRLEAE